MQMDPRQSGDTPSPWRSTPRRSRLIFLAAVFFVFTSFGFANDSMDMGRQPMQRFAFSVLLSGVFAVCYAASGVILRGKFWRAFVLLFPLQFLCMMLLGRHYPASAPLVQYNQPDTQRLQARLALDGIATLVSVTLGYVGFVYVFIGEGRRYVRSQTEKASLESEMVAAREVQRVMVPDTLPDIPGYIVESVYRPAAEVGGDFFQVIPLKSGRTLVVIGDVSGKGLRAAMIVSMIVGMLRTVSDFTEEPAEILAELNHRLCGRTHGGFATCLTVRLDDQGRLAMANAGHPPPYVNGFEFPFAGSMPLGLADAVAYEQTNLDIRPGDRAVLVTDGVAEAQNAQRELLGFSRIETLLQCGATAQAVADIAQQHGQNDDLTIIGLARITDV